ncbi:hypothetical protein [Candidatus Colwellia aromaticivorans]|uniref:hypothetical protein n=1 Tax=Candidatus Colwellia aromaticivorans TaxID=2267621 RepID=UPI000DF1AFFE|nr:hypothetical protein [Candidatus Colwellia aromaticivorans]
MNYNRALLFGRWYRNDIDAQDRQIVEYAELSADGSFEFTFVSTDQETNVTEQIVELGDWGLVGNVHFTITKSELIDQQLYAADLNDSDNYHAYKVLQLDHQTFKYQHIETKEIFIMRKITDNIGHC